jgi:general L-amino acid transport system substrate-binding protein
MKKSMKTYPCPWLLSFAIAASVSACGQPNQNTATSPDSPKVASNSRLATIKSRGKLICGINGEVPGFSFINEKGEYSGLDVDLCRGIAAALFDDPSQVEFRKLSAQERFTALQSGEVDVLSRNTTWTLSRDTSQGLEFAPTTFYDGQGMMVRKDKGITKLADFAGKSVCVLAGTTTEQNLADQMRKVGVKNYSPVASDDVDALYAAYQAGRCEGVSSDRSQLIARRSVLPEPQAHILLKEVMSKEPLGPVVADNDSVWFDVVKWITYTLIQGEEFDINSSNVTTFTSTQDPNIKRFLGTEGNLGEDMGLTNDFALRVIKHVGNYGEIYERNLGKPLGLERGFNQLWTKGGLLYSPPFR